MALYLNSAKRDKKTGKIDKSGPRSTVGNVSRGSAGGYTTGVIDGLKPSGQTDIRGQPVYSQPFTPIVPNSLPSPTSLNASPVGVGALPNSPLVNGYDPNMAQAPTPQTPIQSPAAPTVPTSSSTPPVGAQEALNPVQQQAIDQFIASGAYQQSLEQQGLQSGAAAEVTPSDVMVLQGFAGLAKSAASTLASLARDAALATTLQGSQVLAVQAVPQVASGVVKAGGRAAGKAAVNTATTKGLVELATETTGGKLISLGLILSTLKSSLSTSKDYKKESTAKIIEVTEVLNKLQRSGDPVLQQQGQLLRDQLGEAVNDVNRYRSYAPFGVLSGEVDKDFDDLEILLKEATTKYDNNVQDDAGQAIIEQLGNSPSQEDVDAAKVFLSTLPAGQTKTDLQRSINEAQSQADARAAFEAENEERQRQEFQRQQTESQQAFQTSEREARQAYEQSVRDAANTQRQFEEDTATTSSEGGTLTFGLLGGGGSTEFVDRDTASKAYFDGKTYQELTPAQQRLLNLLKGKGGN